MKEKSSKSDVTANVLFRMKSASKTQFLAGEPRCAVQSHALLLSVRMLRVFSTPFRREEESCCTATQSCGREAGEGPEVRLGG